MLDDLRHHTLIAHADWRGPQRFRTPAGDTREVELEPAPVVPEPAVVKTMLLAGAGIGWLPDFQAADALADGTLVRVLADHPADSVEAHALYPSHRSLSAKVRVFIDSLVAHLAAPR